MLEEAVLERWLAEKIAAHGIPGAQLAVLDGDRLIEGAAGVLSLRTGCPATADALFLPGSIGKLYTATLVMMLAGDGRLDLDEPVRSYLPGFAVADEAARDSVTVRNLLCHTSGFDGDHFVDTGRGDDALERYVATCADLPQIAPPGRIWSYSNSGYVILGRIVERLEGAVFEDVLRRRLYGPLSLRHTVALPEEALVHPTAVGHVPDPEAPGGLMVSPVWGLYRCFGPMGAAVVASAGDVLEFARLHLTGGRAPSGQSLLDAALVGAMQERQVGLVDDTFIGDAWGLGWLRDTWGGVEIIGHDGNSLGQNAFMRLAPERQFGFCLQTNTESALDLYREVAGWLFGERLGVGPRPEPEVSAEPGGDDAARYAGTYRREGLTIEVTSGKDGRLRGTFVPDHLVAEEQGLAPMVDIPFTAVARPDSFLVKLPIADAGLLAVFFDPDGSEERPTYVHFGGRAARRVDS
jgi:CubicO group peptidase (beta-lactamase class C family)